jgi:hypothetical protein
MQPDDFVAREARLELALQGLVRASEIDRRADVFPPADAAYLRATRSFLEDHYGAMRPIVADAPEETPFTAAMKLFLDVSDGRISIDEAESALNALSGDHPSLITPRYLLGLTELVANRHEQAIVIGDELVSTHPHSPRGYMLLAVAFRVGNEPLRSIEAFERATGLGGTFATTTRRYQFLAAEKAKDRNRVKRAYECLCPWLGFPRIPFGGQLLFYRRWIAAFRIAIGVAGALIPFLPQRSSCSTAP